MELIWAFSKLLQYVVIAPLWWLAIQFASIFYPLEGDFRQDFVAFLFCLCLVAGTIAGFAYYDRHNHPEPVVEAQPQPVKSDVSNMDELTRQADMLRALQGANATNPALAH